MAILYVSYQEDPSRWVAAFQKAVPEHDIRVFPDVGDVEDIKYAFAWHPPHGQLKNLPNLEVIFSLGAGVDTLLSDPDLPDVPVVRMVEPGLTTGMVEYVMLHVLRHHRKMPAYQKLQRRKKWKPLPQKPANEVTVGILGMGVLGRACAKALLQIGFKVCSWSKSHKDMPGIESLAGEEELKRFLKQSEILVCLLPLTDETQGILNADLFNRLPKGACLINPARGGHLVDDDLLEALESGQIAEATLDVFHTEPLPQDHPFWDHPKITVTPHAAAYTQPETGAKAVAKQIKAYERGDGLQHLVKGKY